MKAFFTNHGSLIDSAKPDPYAELKKAHAEGKVIQCITINGEWVDCTHLNPPRWNVLPENYRIKPESPPFQLPPPPPGLRWHREDGWQDGDLPEGMRPLVVGEKEHDEDEFCSKLDNDWMPTPDGGRVVRTSYKVRTRRPLTFTHAGKTWTWHRPGDPMPCERDRLVTTLLEDGEIGGTKIRASRYDWNVRDDGDQIIGWRYADEKKIVPFGPEDVPPGSAIYEAGWPKKTWEMITGIELGGVRYGSKYMTWEELEKQSKINRSITLTGKWNPDAWEHCHKQIDA